MSDLPHTWKDYLLDHPSRQDYDDQAPSIQQLITPTETHINNFRCLSENKPIVCMSKSVLGDVIQLSFFHSMKKKAILSNDSTYFCLNGFGPRAYAVRLDPTELFKTSGRQHKVPSFDEIIACNSKQQLLDLTQNDTMVAEKLESHALLPPVIYELLLDLEDYKASNVLEIIINKIKQLRTLNAPELEASDDSSYVSINNATIAELAKEDTPQEDAATDQEGDTFDDEDRTYERSFGRIIKFIWSVIHVSKSVGNTNMIPCSKPSTMAWLDKVHKDHLYQASMTPSTTSRSPSTFMSPEQQIHEYQNMQTSIVNLSHTLNSHHAQELQNKREKERKKADKNFDNLSGVQQNTIKLITATANHTDEDVSEMQPTAMMKVLLEQSSSIKIQAQLQHEYSRRRFICALSSGMCTSIRQGILASQPAHTDINGLSPFCTPNENKEDKLDHATMLFMSEQMELGKVSSTDLKQITKLSITFPTDFSAYVHYVKNFHLLLELLAGPESIIAKAVKTMLVHAIDNERSYRDQAEDEWTFFPSMLDHIHRRTQMFIHSAGEGKVSLLRTKQIDFSPLMEDIEGHNYHHNTPKWLKTKKRPWKDSTPVGNAGKSNSPGGSGNGNDNSPSNNDTKKKDKRGEKVTNNNMVECLKVPSHLKYGDIFHPEMRKGVEVVNHADGTERCNNWHHRGFCYSKCRFRNSHSKTLSADEIDKCKAFLQALLDKGGKKNIKRE